jgi:hypothetical protein
MAYVILILALVTILTISALWYMKYSGSTERRVSESPKTDFEVVNWHQNSTPSHDPPEVATGQEFSHAVRWQNPNAICLLTGQRAANCKCDTHRNMK